MSKVLSLTEFKATKNNSGCTELYRHTKQQSSEVVANINLFRHTEEVFKLEERIKKISNKPFIGVLLLPIEYIMFKRLEYLKNKIVSEVIRLTA